MHGIKDATDKNLAYSDESCGSLSIWLICGRTYKHAYIHCVSKKVPTFKLIVTLSKLNRFSKLLHC